MPRNAKNFQEIPRNAKNSRMLLCVRQKTQPQRCFSHIPLEITAHVCSAITEDQKWLLGHASKPCTARSQCSRNVGIVAEARDTINTATTLGSRSIGRGRSNHEYCNEARCLWDLSTIEQVTRCVRLVPSKKLTRFDALFKQTNIRRLYPFRSRSTWHHGNPVDKVRQMPYCHKQ